MQSRQQNLCDSLGGSSWRVRKGTQINSLLNLITLFILTIFQCFNESFSPIVKKYVRLAVDPDSNNSNLEDETLHLMLNNLTMTTYDCVGPLADAVRANNVSFNHCVSRTLAHYSNIPFTLIISIYGNQLILGIYSVWEHR